MILAVIPARSGSKSIKNKNIARLNGKPLIAYTIEKALACKGIDKVIVSTDSPIIAKVARNYGASIPFLRPQELATDKSPAILTFKHAISYFEKKSEKIDILVELQPTNPFRKIKDITRSIEMLKLPRTDSVVTVCEAEHNPYFVMGTLINKYFKYPLIKPKKPIANRQEAPKVYRLIGSINAVWKKVIMDKSTDITDKTRPFILRGKYTLDIDNPLDLQFAEFLLKYQKSS